MNDRNAAPQRRRWCPPQLVLRTLAPAEPLSVSMTGTEGDLENRENWEYVTF